MKPSGPSGPHYLQLRLQSSLSNVLIGISCDFYVAYLVVNVFQASYPHPKHPQHLIAVVIDHLHGDLAGGGPVEGAAFVR